MTDRKYLNGEDVKIGDVVFDPKGNERVVEEFLGPYMVSTVKEGESYRPCFNPKVLQLVKRADTPAITAADFPRVTFAPAENQFEEVARAIDSQLKLSSNPKDAVGSSKAGLSYVPMGPLYLVGLAMMEGAIKYGQFNWRDSAVDNRIYIDAAHRHLHKYWNGETHDPVTGIHHIAYCIAGLLVLLDAEQNGCLIDTRPTPMKEGLIDGISKLVPGVVAFANKELEARLAKAKSTGA